jgi:hypothetical protein
VTPAAAKGANDFICGIGERGTVRGGAPIPRLDVLTVGDTWGCSALEPPASAAEVGMAQFFSRPFRGGTDSRE